MIKNRSPFNGQTREAGKASFLSLRTFLIISFFPSPVDTKATALAEINTGKVKVTLLSGGLGLSLIGTTIFSFSFKMSYPGKKEQIKLVEQQNNERF